MSRNAPPKGGLPGLRLSPRFLKCHADFPIKMPLNLIQELNSCEREECSSNRIYGAFSLENVLKSVSNDFHGQVGRKKAF